MVNAVEQQQLMRFVVEFVVVELDVVKVLYLLNLFVNNFHLVKPLIRQMIQQRPL